MNKITPLALACAIGAGFLPSLFGAPESRRQDSKDPVTLAEFHQSVPAFPDGQSLVMESALSHGVLLAGGTREFFLRLNFFGAELEEARERPGLNLSLVIDRSGSMASERKLEFAKSAADQMVSRLDARDSLSIITYDNDATVVISSRKAGEHGVFHDAIGDIQTGGSTNLYDGLVAGYEEVRDHQDEERLHRVLLLSDGLPTAGIQSRDEIWKRAEECQRHGVRISTMGMGLDYDEVLMQQLAQRSGGNYYYVAHPENVGDFLEAELTEMGLVVARNPEVKLRLGSDVQVMNVYGYSYSREGDSLTIPMRDLASGEQRKMVLRLRVRSNTDRQPIAKAALRYTDAETQEGRSATNPGLRVRFSSDPMMVVESRNLEVLAQVEVTKNGQAMIDAMELQQQGGYDQAWELLDSRYRASDELNRSAIQSMEVQRTLDWMGERKDEIQRTRHSASARRDLKLRGSLEAMGYL